MRKERRRGGRQALIKPSSRSGKEEEDAPPLFLRGEGKEGRKVSRNDYESSGEKGKRCRLLLLLSLLPLPPPPLSSPLSCSCMTDCRALVGK